MFLCLIWWNKYFAMRLLLLLNIPYRFCLNVQPSHDPSMIDVFGVTVSMSRVGMCRCRCTQTQKTARPSDHRARARSNPTTATSWWNEQEGTCGQSPYDSHDVMPYVMSLMSGALARKSPWSISTPSLMALLVVFVVFGCTITTQSATFATLRYDITCRVCWMQEPCQRLGEYPHVPAGCSRLRRHQPVARCRSAALPNLHCITMHTHLRLPGNDATYTHTYTSSPTR